MLKYCLKQWDKNRHVLEAALKADMDLYSCDYKHLVELIVKHILNNNSDYQWDPTLIVEIDQGDYQGTLLYLIPRYTYQPNECEYIMTFVDYGSCSGCDTLQSIQGCGTDVMCDSQIRDFMILCKDLITNIVKPYNEGWRKCDDFDIVEEATNEN